MQNVDPNPTEHPNDNLKQWVSILVDAAKPKLYVPDRCRYPKCALPGYFQTRIEHLYLTASLNGN